MCSSNGFDKRLLYQPLFSINPWQLTIFQGLKRILSLSRLCTFSSRWTTKFTRLTQNLYVNHDIWQMRDRDQLEWPTLQVLLIMRGHLQYKPRKAHKYTGERPQAWSMRLFLKAVKLSSWWLGTGKWAQECLLLYMAKSLCISHLLLLYDSVLKLGLCLGDRMKTSAEVSPRRQNTIHQ